MGDQIDTSTLTSDNPVISLASDLVNQYANQRIAIGVAILLGYFFHYATFGSVYLMKNGKSSELKEVEKNMFLFGIAGILSCNVLQSGIYQAVLAYFTLVCLLLLHLPVLNSQQYVVLKKYFWLAFYFMLFMWYFGIIVDYYDFYTYLQV